jgi:hypothetical protein
MYITIIASIICFVNFTYWCYLDSKWQHLFSMVLLFVLGVDIPFFLKAYTLSSIISCGLAVIWTLYNIGEYLLDDNE